MSSFQVTWFGPEGFQWSWLLDHFQRVDRLNEEDLLQDSSISDRVRYSVEKQIVLFGLDTRSDARIELVRRFADQHATEGSNVRSFGIVLGSDWIGHRRTFPLPETWPTFYWYQLHDRIIPWLLTDNKSKAERTKSIKKKTATQPALSPRLQLIIAESESYGQLVEACSAMHATCLIVTDSTVQRDLWLATCHRIKVTPIAVADYPEQLFVQPELIVIDRLSESIGCQPTLDLIMRLRAQFPNAYIMGVDGFPSWRAWGGAIRIGIHSIIPRPANLIGALKTWMIAANRSLA